MQLSTFTPQQIPFPKPPMMLFTPFTMSHSPLSRQGGQQPGFIIKNPPFD
jgi:hypothetical protein